MVRNRATFSPISGYKKIVKCRLCGERIEDKGYNHYCDKCLKRIKKSDD